MPGTEEVSFFLNVLPCARIRRLVFADVGWRFLAASR